MEDLLRAIINLRRLFNETIEIQYDSDGYVSKVEITTKKETGETVKVTLNFTWDFYPDGKPKKLIIDKVVS